MNVRSLARDHALLRMLNTTTQDASHEAGSTHERPEDFLPQLGDIVPRFRREYFSGCNGYGRKCCDLRHRCCLYDALVC